MKILRWCEWAEAVVKMLVEVRPGENLLILTDTAIDSDVGEACLSAGTSARANTHLMVLPYLPQKDYTLDFRSATGAIQGADVLKALCAGLGYAYMPDSARQDSMLRKYTDDQLLLEMAHRGIGGIVKLTRPRKKKPRKKKGDDEGAEARSGSSTTASRQSLPKGMSSFFCRFSFSRHSSGVGMLASAASAICQSFIFVAS